MATVMSIQQAVHNCPRIYRKSVLHLLNYRFVVYLSRCSTNLWSILGHSVYCTNWLNGNYKKSSPERIYIFYIYSLWSYHNDIPLRCCCMSMLSLQLFDCRNWQNAVTLLLVFINKVRNVKADKRLLFWPEIDLS